FAVWVDPTTLFQRPAVAWGSILALALWNTTITQFLWIGGLAAAADMTRASYLFFLKPVIAAGLALGLLGDELSLLQAAAMLVVMASVLVEVFWPRFGRRPEGGASGN
ncbi:MAG: EamA family transporter, partial [Alphaproteobacteria bacterium]|nr:EamA family transporter [Alphaproteobacteria bacterium]